MRSLRKVEFFDTGPPPAAGRSIALQSVLDQIGTATYMMHAGAMTLVDLETDLSVEELQRYICDHFFFSGTVEIDGEIKIVRKGDLDVEEQKRRLIAAE